MKKETVWKNKLRTEIKRRLKIYIKIQKGMETTLIELIKTTIVEKLEYLGGIMEYLEELKKAREKMQIAVKTGDRKTAEFYIKKITQIRVAQGILPMKRKTRAAIRTIE